MAVAPAHASAAADHLRAVDTLSTQIRLAFDNVQVALEAPLAEAPPQPASANGSRGASGRGRGGDGHANGKAAAPHGGPAGREVAPVSVPPMPADGASAAAAAPSEAAAAVPIKPVPLPARAPAAPARKWGVVAPAAPAADDGEGSLPTPAEAAKAAGKK